MPKWSSDTFPSKYRYLQKKIESIEEALKALPQPRLDFFALSPKERDLVEIYFRCEFAIVDKQNTHTIKQEPNQYQIKIPTKELLELLAETLDEDQLKELLLLSDSYPLFIEKGFTKFWERHHPRQLIKFLSQQQELYRWVPSPGELRPSQLTWEAWDELLSLVNANGYNQATDDISQLKPLEKWSPYNQKRIIHLYLEMINSKDVIASFLEAQNYIGDPPKIRKRLPIHEESHYSGITYRKKKSD